MAKKKASAKPAKKSMEKVIKPKVPIVKDPLTKKGIYDAIRAITGDQYGNKDISNILDALHTVIELHVKSRGPGKFTLPGLLKITVVKKPAQPAREGTNPFTGEKMMFKAKPARRVVKIRALSKLKEMLAN